MWTDKQSAQIKVLRAALLTAKADDDQELVDYLTNLDRQLRLKQCPMTPDFCH